MPSLRERATLIQKASADIELQAVLNEKCKRDILFWFNNFCWTYNPRVAPYNFPFNLYPYQEEVIHLIKATIDDNQQLLIKKSRDMGATWMILLVFQWFWLFEPGSDFHLTSITEQDIDKIGVKSTLFQKLRYNYKYLPSWMAPPMGKSNDSYMKLVHPTNGNAITGQAPVENFGTSQRYKAVLMDEMSKLKNAAGMFTNVSQTTDCLIMPYTPYGKANEAYRLANSGDLEKYSLSK